MSKQAPTTLNKGILKVHPRDRAAVQFTPNEKREVFRGMVVAELDSGFLRYSRRKALMRYADRLRIPEFEACLLIADAQYHAGDIEPIQFESAATLEAITRPEAWSISLRLGVALAGAAIVDGLLIYWLFG